MLYLILIYIVSLYTIFIFLKLLKVINIDFPKGIYFLSKFNLITYLRNLNLD